MQKQERDYILGTHDEEIARLGLQHRVWRPRALGAWQRAGFTAGQTILDIGCGPGYATIDLAEIVGPGGRVVAIDRSKRFLGALEAARLRSGLGNITAVEMDLDDPGIPRIAADGSWSRWVFAFVKNPKQLLERVAGSLKPGGVFVAHEYFDYSTWRLAPRVPEMEEFVDVVMESWRADGGEPDIGLDLPVWLRELGFEIRSLQPIVETVTPAAYLWQWPKAFVQVGLQRLVDLGRMTPERSRAVSDAFAAAEAKPHTFLITPAVLEIVAVRR